MGFIRGKKEVKISDILDFVIPYLREEDFIIKKEYKVRASVSNVMGKWPQTFGNAFFTDSKYLLPDIFDMLKVNVQQFL